MNIDRSNYEIWIIDWLDGNLSELQAEQLRNFLDENPDLKEESGDLPVFRLIAGPDSFPDKSFLKKTNNDLYAYQFELLSAGFLENDLSEEQIADMRKAMAPDPEKKRTFDLIQKMKLSPPEVRYKYKNRLYKKTFTQIAIRLSLIGLSAAAVIAFTLVSYLSKPQLPIIRSGKSARVITADSSISGPAVKITAVNSNKLRMNAPAGKQKNHLRASVSKAALIAVKIIPDELHIDSLIRSSGPNVTIPARINVPEALTLMKVRYGNNLVALKLTDTINDPDDDRPRLGRFIAKVLREKILKEKPQKDKPLNIYEIAEAGVTELNKLFGWEMALDERKDSNGELKSVYFSSRILKFNAPVKKSVAAQ